MTKTALLALAAILSASAAQAGEIKPLAAQSVVLEDASGVVYYTNEAEGFRVVATMSAVEGAAPVRFVATLADGQAVTVSIPAEAGKAPRELEISRDGDVLTVGDAEPLMVRASLD
jgi:hypothetical protein